MDDSAHQSLGWCLWQAPVTPSHPCQGYDKAPASGVNGNLINMGESLNRKSDNGVNGTGMSCEGPSPGRCSPAQQRGPGRHHATARMKWNKEVNLPGDTDKECLENGGIGECLSQQSNV